MSKLVTLSTGEQVYFREKFTHKAEKAYSNELQKGAVEKEYIDDGKVVRETPTANITAAIEAALLSMIEKVTKDKTDSTPTIEWLDDLPEGDYGLLIQKVVDIRKEGRAGKKNS